LRVPGTRIRKKALQRSNNLLTPNRRPEAGFFRPFGTASLLWRRTAGTAAKEKTGRGSTHSQPLTGIDMDKAFPWLIAAGLSALVCLRLLGHHFYSSLVFSVILLGCYFYLFCPPLRRREAKSGRSRWKQVR
jgi:hypothetical protein